MIIALPSKGSLYDGTLAFLKGCGLPVSREGRGRGYWGKIGSLDGAVAQFLRAEEIPIRVEAGDVLMGVTGYDLHQESCLESTVSQVLFPQLGFGHARLVVAIPRVWIDVNCMEDVAEVAADLKRTRGYGLRVGTKFHRLTRRFFAEHSIRDYLIVDSRGATEGMPASGTADIVVDLTSSGATIIENGLKEIQDGTVVSSEASVIVSTRPENWNDEAMAVLSQVVDSIEAGLRARRRKLVHFSAEPAKQRSLTRSLASQFGCEVHDHHSEDEAANAVFVSVVCPSKNVYPVVRHLRAEGATGISVLQPELLFEDASATVQNFRELLRG